MSQVLQSFGVTVFDPWFKPDVRGLHEYGREDVKSGERIRERIRRQKGQTEPDCYTGYCECDAVSALKAGLQASIPQSAIYTRTDGIVDWRVCINDDPATNFEVSGTHVGLVFNATVYGLIAQRLSATQIKSSEDR